MSDPNPFGCTSLILKISRSISLGLKKVLEMAFEKKDKFTGVEYKDKKMPSLTCIT